MSVTLEKVNVPHSRAERVAKPKKKHTYAALIIAWVFLIACGVIGTKLYSDHLREQIANQVGEETSAQLHVIQKDYQKQISELKTSMETDISTLQTKVDSLTELLAFAKDSANDKTDNSNQLYTQLTEVKKKLAELQKNLDVLK